MLKKKTKIPKCPLLPSPLFALQILLPLNKYLSNLGKIWPIVTEIFHLKYFEVLFH
jgi:hypothetical protein